MPTVDRIDVPGGTLTKNYRPSLTFYLAARYSRREELDGYRQQLVELGHKVPARWLDGEHQAHGIEAARIVETDGRIHRDPSVAEKFAVDDIEDLMAADVVVSFTEPPRSGASRGGRHVEFGVVLGLRKAGQLRRMYIVGERENVFHALPEVDGVFDTWGEFVAHLVGAPQIHGWDLSGNSRCDSHPWHRSSPHHEAAWSGIVAR